MIWVFLLCSAWIHDFHFSRLEMNYNSRDQVIECTLSVFIDDLEAAISRIAPMKYHLGTKKEVSHSDEVISEYLSQKIRLKGQSEEKKLNYIGKELSDDLMAFHIHFWVPWDSIDPLSIQIELFHELFDDQKNMVEFAFGEKSFHHLFDSNKTEKRIQ